MVFGPTVAALVKSVRPPGRAGGGGRGGLVLIREGKELLGPGQPPSGATRKHSDRSVKSYTDEESKYIVDISIRLQHFMIIS